MSDFPAVSSSKVHANVMSETQIHNLVFSISVYTIKSESNILRLSAENI